MLPVTDLLLMPICAENPAGDNLEYESIFDEIRLARESDPDYLPQDGWSASEPRKADWNQVCSLSVKALEKQTKDLQLACWLVEALSHLQGLDGMIYGMEFLKEFITRFWLHCWPAPDEDGLTIRRSKLQRLDRDLSHALLCQPLLDQPETSLSFWKQILVFEHKINSQPSIRDELIRQEGDYTMESFEQKARRFSSIEIVQQLSKAKSLAVAITQLETSFHSLSQDQEDDLFSQTSRTLADIIDYLERLGQRAIPQAGSVISVGTSIDEAVPQTTEIPERPVMKTMNRELAISQMLAIADFFRQTEPSSPVPYLMERAARWATMTLSEWLEEMLNDSNSINEINNVLTGQHQ